jgi:hypothetical protein
MDETGRDKTRPPQNNHKTTTRQEVRQEVRQGTRQGNIGQETNKKIRRDNRRQDEQGDKTRQQKTRYRADKNIKKPCPTAAVRHGANHKYIGDVLLAIRLSLLSLRRVKKRIRVTSMRARVM